MQQRVSDDLRGSSVCSQRRAGSHTAGQSDDGDSYSTGVVAAQASMVVVLQPTVTMSRYLAVTAQNVPDMQCGATALAYLQVHLPVHCQRSK